MEWVGQMKQKTCSNLSIMSENDALQAPSMHTATMFSGPASSVMVMTKLAMKAASLISLEVSTAFKNLVPAAVASSPLIMGLIDIEVHPSEMSIAPVSFIRPSIFFDIFASSFASSAGSTSLVSCFRHGSFVVPFRAST